MAEALFRQPFVARRLFPHARNASIDTMMSRPVSRTLLVLAVLGWTAATAVSAAEPLPILKVLFLGDRGHHRPADRAAQLIPVMAGRGIDVTYTEKMSDINPQTLAKYDALLIYANIDQIEPPEEQALLAYVAGGGGLVPLHCASYCFRNSAAYVALVGAQFQRHGTGEFDTTTVDPDHPILKGFEPFHTWDETYVHSQHNEKDRLVLQTRTERNTEEPWTWVRTHGKGRVFYTAYGHDARTWAEPGFQALVERGIRWAAQKGDVFDSRMRAKTGLKPLAYEKAAGELPNYLPGKNWGTLGEAISQMQKPISPEESQKHLVMPPGFEAQLFAAEPEITKPVAMNWDHRGRLWIVETVDYPNSLQPEGEGHDRIKICEDTNGDGRADKFTIFADKLSIPTSLIHARGGVIIHQAPHTLFLKDTDGDDRADVREILFTGWNTSDTHAGPSNLRYGLDNWIWGIVGYSGFKGQVGGENLDFRTGFYRFKPDGSQLEFLRNTNNNSWGVGFSEEGIVFGSTANGNPSVYLPIPNRYYEAVRGWSSSVLGNTAADSRFFPITEHVRQVDLHGRFTAGAGHALYTARAYPKTYWNRTAFVNEPTGHLTATFVLEPVGSDFISYNSWNLVASDDEWTSPIVAEVGPDGQVWMIDWYNYIIQHNPTPKGFQTGKGNAYETPLRDRTHGRIYRIVYNADKPAAPAQLDPQDPATLVAGLASDNMFWRIQAQRLLVERGNSDVVPALIKLTENSQVDELGLNPAAIHALGTLQGLGALGGSHPAVENAVAAALKHPSAGVRRNAVQVLPRTEQAVRPVLESGVLTDSDPQVRLAAFLALAELPPDERAAAAIAAALQSPANTEDRWIPEAATSAAARHDFSFLRVVASFKGDAGVPAKLLEITTRVAEHYARGVPAESVGKLMPSLATAPPAVADAIVAGLVGGWPKDQKAQLNDSVEAAMVQVLARVSPAARGQLVLLGTRWGSENFQKYTAEITASFLLKVQDARQKDPARVAAALELIDFRKQDPAAARELLKQISPRTSPELAGGLIDAISKSEAPEVGRILIDGLATLTPAVRPRALRALLGRGDWTESLMQGIEDGKIQWAELSLDQKQTLAAHPNKALAARAKKLLSQGGGLPDPDRQKVIDALSAEVLKSGDAAKGKLVFVQQCAKCHTHSGEGKQIGPDLTGMAAHPKAELLIHILDPSRSVEGNFRQYTVVTDDGRIFTGLLASESKTGIELIDSEAKTHPLLRENIEEFVATTKSLMPEGFEKQVPASSIADLLEFLTQRGKYLPLDLRKVATIVSTEGMFYSKEAGAERLIFPDWSPKTFAGVPFQLVDPQGDRVPNVVMLYGPTGKFPPTMPKSVSLPCNAPVKAIHFLSGVSGWGATGPSPDPSVTMIVRLHYADGTTEDHPLKNGLHFADYIRVVDVPESKLAFKLRDQQIRYLAVYPKQPGVIERIELVKGTDNTAPVVMAVTVETRE
jgi:hypothetical protein